VHGRGQYLLDVSCEHEELAAENLVIFHIHIAADVKGHNVRIVTVYVPDPNKWDTEFRIRRVP